MQVLIHAKSKPAKGAKAAVVHTVTSAPMSVAQDTDMRMRRYLITMGVRTACFILCVIVEGWLRWVFVAGAAVLPYIAVVLANAVGPRWGSRIQAFDKYADHDGLGAAPVSNPVVGPGPAQH